MRLRYDPASGALYFRVREGNIEETLETGTPGAYLDIDAQGRVVGLEFLSFEEFTNFLLLSDGEFEVPERIEDPELFEEQVRLAAVAHQETARGTGLVVDPTAAQTAVRSLRTPPPLRPPSLRPRL